MPWLLLLCLAAFAACASESVPGPIEADVVRVVDGDTLVVRARIWPGQVVETAVRLAGIDAPERHGACAAERALAERAALRLAELAGSRVRLTAVVPDKFGGRVRASVEAADGRDIDASLIGEGLARAYAGRRRGWCP